jgi:hypothetical protein
VNAKSLRRLKTEVDAWADETRVLLAACRHLIEHFATARELKSWDAAVAPTLGWVSIVAGQFAPRPPKLKTLPRWDGGPPFRGSLSTARMISPLVEIVGGPVAQFVFTIRKIVPQGEQSKYIRSYGHFSASFGFAVTHPLWTTYRQFAPQEWKDCFPARKPTRGARMRRVRRRPVRG